MSRLDEIKARVEAATAGPWHYVHGYGFGGSTGPLRLEGDGETTPDKRFVAHARQDIPYLIEQFEIAKELLQEGLDTCLSASAKRSIEYALSDWKDGSQ